LKEIDVGKRKRDKRPVLTSPWKIGTMVALMLVATSFGVGYYMVRVYDIDLYWLSSDVSRWVVDSYQFFREIYPAAAGVVLLSLFTYFVIATAVRRYKYYLNSGQDYRKMISLANSIDDLTNPAQIARLSDYPRLQKVLKNYGDQIREISEDIESREVEMSSVDFEVEIDSILEGKGLNKTIAEGKWWFSIAKKVQDWADENAGGTAQFRKMSEAARQTAGRASLSCGKVVETAAGASEDILDIVKSAGELNAVVENLGSSGSGTADAGSPSDAIVAIETAVAALEERSSAIHDLSEEGNGLALNIALMAARGEATEKDLALLAEKVRATAERFGKLGRELEGLVRTVASSSRNARSSAGGSVVAGTGTSPEVESRIIEISTKIESRSQALQQKIMALGSDVEEINKELQSDQGGDDRIRATDGSIVNFGAGAVESADEPDGIDDSDLVIDHGKVWQGPEPAPENDMEVEGDASAPSDDVTEEDVTDDSDEALSGFQEAMSAMLSDADQPQVDEVPAEEPASEEAEISEETSEEAEEEEVQAEEAPDVVDELFAGDPVAEAEQEASPQQETVVEADLSADENWDNMQEQTDDWVKVEVEPVVDNAPADEISAVEPEVVPDPDAEPVHDLFELGAEEYVEETEVNL
jgi:methyl-accepting chemotaxis protein